MVTVYTLGLLKSTASPDIGLTLHPLDSVMVGTTADTSVPSGNVTVMRPALSSTVPSVPSTVKVLIFTSEDTGVSGFSSVSSCYR